MALPAIADMRQHFSEATLALAARSGLAPLFESVPGVDLVVRLESRAAAGRGGARTPGLCGHTSSIWRFCCRTRSIQPGSSGKRGSRTVGLSERLPARASDGVAGSSAR